MREQVSSLDQEMTNSNLVYNTNDQNKPTPSQPINRQADTDVQDSIKLNNDDKSETTPC